MDFDVVPLANHQAGFAKFMRQSIFVDFLEKPDTERVRNDFSP